MDNTEFTRVAWADDARILEQGGVTPETLGKMGENGFDPHTGKKILDTLNAKGTDPILTNKVLQGSSSTAADEIVTKMDPADRLIDVSNIMDSTTYSMDRTILETGRTMKVDVKTVGNKEIYVDDVVNRAGAFEYNQLLLKTMQDNGVDEATARIILENQGNSLVAITSRMKNSVMSDTGTLGEKVALKELLQRSDLTVLGPADGFLKKSINQHGFDYICMDAQGNYVIMEVKGTAKKEKFSKSLLTKDSNGYRQMSDEWITSRIESMKMNNMISDSLYQDLKNVNGKVYPDRTIKKELYIVQDRPLDGNTVDSSFAEYPTEANPNREKLKIEMIKVLKVGGTKYLKNQFSQG